MQEDGTVRDVASFEESIRNNLRQQKQMYQRQKLLLEQLSQEMASENTDDDLDDKGEGTHPLPPLHSSCEEAIKLNEKDRGLKQNVVQVDYYKNYYKPPFKVASSSNQLPLRGEECLDHNAIRAYESDVLANLELKDQLRTIQKMQTSIKEKQEEVHRLREQCHLLEQRSKVKDDDILRKDAELAKQKGEVEQLKSQLQQAQEQLRNTKQHTVTLLEHQGMKKERNQLRVDLKAAVEREKELRHFTSSHVARLQEEVVQLKKANQVLRQSGKQIKEQLTASTKTNQEKQTEIEAMRHELEHIQVELTAYKEENNHMHLEIQRKQKACNDIEGRAQVSVEKITASCHELQASLQEERLKAQDWQLKFTKQEEIMRDLHSINDSLTMERHKVISLEAAQTDLIYQVQEKSMQCKEFSDQSQALHDAMKNLKAFLDTLHQSFMEWNEKAFRSTHHTAQSEEWVLSLRNSADHLEHFVFSCQVNASPPAEVKGIESLCQELGTEFQVMLQKWTKYVTTYQGMEKRLWQYEKTEMDQLAYQEAMQSEMHTLQIKLKGMKESTQTEGKEKVALLREYQNTVEEMEIMKLQIQHHEQFFSTQMRLLQEAQREMFLLQQSAIDEDVQSIPVLRNESEPHPCPASLPATDLNGKSNTEIKHLQRRYREGFQSFITELTEMKLVLRSWRDNMTKTIEENQTLHEKVHVQTQSFDKSLQELTEGHESVLERLNKERKDSELRTKQLEAQVQFLTEQQEKSNVSTQTNVIQEQNRRIESHLLRAMVERLLLDLNKMKKSKQELQFQKQYLMQSIAHLSAFQHRAFQAIQRSQPLLEHICMEGSTSNFFNDMESFPSFLASPHLVEDQSGCSRSMDNVLAIGKKPFRMRSLVYFILALRRLRQGRLTQSNIHVLYDGLFTEAKARKMQKYLQKIASQGLLKDDKVRMSCLLKDSAKVPSILETSGVMDHCIQLIDPSFSSPSTTSCALKKNQTWLRLDALGTMNVCKGNDAKVGPCPSRSYEGKMKNPRMTGVAWIMDMLGLVHQTLLFCVRRLHDLDYQRKLVQQECYDAYHSYEVTEAARYQLEKKVGEMSHWQGECDRLSTEVNERVSQEVYQSLKTSYEEEKKQTQHVLDELELIRKEKVRFVERVHMLEASLRQESKSSEAKDENLSTLQEEMLEKNRCIESMQLCVDQLKQQVTTLNRELRLRTLHLENVQGLWAKHCSAPKSLRSSVSSSVVVPKPMTKKTDEKHEIVKKHEKDETVKKNEIDGSASEDDGRLFPEMNQVMMELNRLTDKVKDCLHEENDLCHWSSNDIVASPTLRNPKDLPIDEGKQMILEKELKRSEDGVSKTKRVVQVSFSSSLQPPTSSPLMPTNDSNEALNNAANVYMNQVDTKLEQQYGIFALHSDGIQSFRMKKGRNMP